MEIVVKPKPGSPQAVKLGCSCPVMDNHHGEKADGQYWINGGCPIHGIEARLREEKGNE